jgi:glycosyltransferase involved in cell wall biosynthesis
MKLSLVIPCYNEEKNLPLLLKHCGAVARMGEIEVVLVDNGSTDNSANVLRELLPDYSGCRSIRIDVNQGYGFGILSGLRCAKGEILGWTHADMQTDPADTLKGLALFDAHGPGIFVKGQRHGRALADVLFTIGMSIFETVLLAKPFWDINAQPTMFSRHFFESWDADAPHDFSLDLYAYFMARKVGLSVHRFPVQFGKRAHGVSHWNINWAAKKKFIRRTINFSFELRRKVSS